MATAGEEGNKAYKLEAAEKEMSKKCQQKDNNHGIDERSYISTFDASHLASTGEESLGYKTLVRERLRSSSRELEGLEEDLRFLSDSVKSLDIALGEAEEKLNEATQKLEDVEEKLNEG